MKRMVLAATGAAAVSLAGYGVYVWLLPEETRIRQRLESMAAAFNNHRRAACVEGLAEDFRDETANVGKPEVSAALLHVFFRRRDPTTKKCPYRVEMPRDEISIRLRPDAEKRADVTLLARFFEQRGEKDDLVWEVRISADLEKRDDGWIVRRTSHETLGGSARF